jgi:ABC-type uncharacterized transport system substrate-binding protein
MMISRRQFVSALGASALAVSLASLAQQRRDIPLVGVLIGGAPDTHSALYEAFRRGLRDAGLREGVSLRLEVRWARGRIEAFSQLARELVALKPAVIVSATTPGLLATAEAAQGRIAIVMASADDPTMFGLAKSFARPGGNVTGTVNLLHDLEPKQLELLRLAKPGLRRVGLLENPTNRSSVERVKTSAARMLKLGATPIVAGASTADQLADAFEQLERGGAEALVIEADAFFIIQRELIGRLAIERGLPTLTAFSEMVDGGAMMSYGVSLPDSYHRAAYFVDRILKGAKPAELPIEQPTQVELVINLKTAKALGVSVSRELLLRADRVIE